MSNRKKILILFEGPHIAYSPTIAQLYKELENYFEVTVFSQDPADFSNNVDLPYQMEIYKIPKGWKRYIYRIIYEFTLLINSDAKKIDRYMTGRYGDYFFRFLKIKRFLKQKRFDKVICVDLKNLFFVNSMLKTKCYFISLELCNNENLIPFIDYSLLDCVIIQSPERFNYIFKEADLRKFYIQNAPVFNAALLKQKKNGLIYTGTAMDPFGFGYCLDYLIENPEDKLFVLGTLKHDLIAKKSEYKELILSKRLIINDIYIPDEDVVEFISNYEIGFCFYNFDYTWIDNFNYKSAPSGKMFKYFAAGIPVICNKIIGFSFVDEFECGIRIEKFDAGTIKSAIKMIRDNYEYYVNGAVKAAAHFDFNKAVKPFINFIKEDIGYTESLQKKK